MKLLIHDHTANQIEALVRSTSHAILLVGPRGSGKRALTDHLIERILGVNSIQDHPYGKIIQPNDGKAIGIEEVRELEHFMSLKVPGKAATDRFVVVEDAHLLTTEAQNALLKTLEEPPEGSLLILTSAHEQALLPTIRSRTQMIKVNVPDRQAISDYFQGLGYDEATIRRAVSISGGLPGLVKALLSEDEHELKTATDYARRILSKTAYERLLMVDELAKQRQLSANICFILQQMARVSLQKAQGAQARKWQAILEAAYKAGEQLNSNAQPKLVLDKLMLSI